MARAARLYNGRPLLNSVSGKRASMDAVFPVAQKYGAVLIALTLDDEGIPDSAEGRVAIAETILAEKYGPRPDAPAPVAASVPVTQSGRIVWCSGQLPVRNGEKPYVGRLGAEVSAEDGYAAAQLCALNLLAQLKKHLGDLDRITRILDARIYVASTPEFTQQPQVANGLSDLMVEVFGEQGKHARCAFGVASLPLNMPVEAELTVEVAEG